MKNKRIIQLIIGILFFSLGTYFSYESITMPTFFSQGLLVGQGSVFLLWGIREIAGSLIKQSDDLK